MQDADILDRVGPMGVWHIICRGFASDSNIDNTLLFGNGEMRTKKLFLLKRELNFSLSRYLFDRKTEFEHQLFKAIGRCQKGELQCEYASKP